MAQYSFRARNAAGKLERGSLDAFSRDEAAAVLRDRNYIIIDIQERRFRQLNIRSLLKKRVSRRDLSVFCRQLSVMIDAGVPLLSALKVLENQAAKTKLKQSLGKVHESLESGSSLTAALGEHPRIFPSILVRMVEAGETGGVLDSVLYRMAEYFEWEHGIKENIKSALVYPAVVLVVAALMVAFIVTFVLPVFADILGELDVTLPLITRVVLGFSETVRNYWFFVIPLVLLAVYVIYRYLNTEGGKEKRDKLVLKIPVISDLMRKTVVSRFCQTLATLLKGGVPVLEALKVVRGAVGNRVIERHIAKAEDSIRDGEGMTAPLKESGVFPPMVTEMIAVGEESGAVDTMLERVGEFYDREVEDTAKRISTVIEPVLIVSIGIVVGLILLSVLLPIFNVIGSVQ